ncbi:MAG TPA: universal stress protein [Candidatus Thermoplasmatota archaeon]|nr:universal stress protein [Candidatus Thermoplasmatota archaeon]
MSRLLVAFDGSGPSEAALAYAARRAAVAGDEVVLVTVVPSSLQESFLSKMLLPGVDLSKVVGAGSFAENARKRLEAAAAPLKEKKIKVSVEVRAGESAEMILVAARELGAHEIILGHKSYEQLANFPIGNVADKVVRHAPVTVTVVRP